MSLAPLRQQIDQIDQEIIRLLTQRMTVSRQVAKIKIDQNLPVLNAGREVEILEKLEKMATNLGMRQGFISEIYTQIFAESKKIQEEIMNEK
jgi:chorismate mutase